MPFIVAQAPPPPSQLVRIIEVAGDAALSAWRAGMNLIVPDLPKKIAELLAHELDSNGLQIVPTEFGRGLACARAYCEGEVLCNCSTLWYTSQMKLQEMLSQGGNKLLLDRLVRIDGLLMGDDDAPSLLYGALVGAAGYAQHYQGLRKGGPNAILKINTEHGPNDNLMQLVVKTRNNQGIAAKQVICINYGSDYDFTFTTDDTETEVKKFRGALDKYFARAEQATGDDPKTPAETPKAKASPPTTAAAAKECSSEPSQPEQATTEVLPKAKAKAKATPAEGQGQGQGQESKAKAAAPPPPAVVAADEKELCIDIKGLGVKLVYTLGTGSASGSFGFVSDSSSNRKIPPHTKLHLIREGKLQSNVADGSLAYDLTQPKKTMACVLQSSDRNDVSEPKTLDTVINEMKITKITLRDDTPSGVCPPHLIGKKPDTLLHLTARKPRS
jgi:hypothetical protein